MSQKRRLQDHDINPCLELYEGSSADAFALALQRSTTSRVQLALFFYLPAPFYELRSSSVEDESDASRKCLEVNQSDKDMCAIFFLKYKSCRKFWHGIMMQRRQDGIKPYMPIAEERKKILASLGRAPY
ncbi:coiled-coil-helix-coiled-coil-helix domain-containing protein 7 isoform X2 [Pantherophis guttatus]|uniref:Coiled-coil-helix-coiled-coil-helix domain-containing protein 7 n=1 Tax=Pantherophis guttatus TaxID=94885 RepID=A0A6P9CRM5_PANGU|nr:coiled-coil-helix-coiled-coil-helix domain-containing protein 7 isoform X2 [Pantherophis guttatus]XP_034285704.1 coiled-coil-helix-coiled-coil-helix domain-containing protein 7 isoform X2 [Pantherophis guttatus]XP_034285705.1 coiled-coil-helix-coiled-coil-helix domain-containing protein 7 isoform X2 [Pantherophis guttatus]XP_060537952.1 coiled-coil-helix-coiled-coil-helix domain-containing protein 7 isoform X2 [Pantherophis guttatus]XP_060537953.1 coiled-coil-helix-coiled-coil-helix domain-c